MQTDLVNLEAKVTQLAALYVQSRGETIALRASVLQLQTENKQLAEKIGGARARLEGLMAKLPALAEPDTLGVDGSAAATPVASA
jgi:hypothetical protein